MNLYIITGASKGLGQAIAQYAIQNDHQVINISRSNSTLNDVIDINFNLLNIDGISEMLHNVCQRLNLN